MQTQSLPTDSNVWSWDHISFLVPKPLKKTKYFKIFVTLHHIVSLCLSLLQNCHELEKMDLEECVQVNKQSERHRYCLNCRRVEAAVDISVSFYFCIRSQMGHSSSCLSTALVCKSWWVCVCHLHIFCSCSIHKLPITARSSRQLSNGAPVLVLLCCLRACLTVSWSPTMASDTSAAAPVLTTAWRWSSWTTAPWSQTPHWSTWRAAIVWIASSSTTASRSPAPASRD